MASIKEKASAKLGGFGLLAVILYGSKRGNVGGSLWQLRHKGLKVALPASTLPAPQAAGAKAANEETIRNTKKFFTQSSLDKESRIGFSYQHGESDVYSRICGLHLRSRTARPLTYMGCALSVGTGFGSADLKPAPFRLEFCRISE
jgi:hypothetical protein